jgi:putative endonuclease
VRSRIGVAMSLWSLYLVRCRGGSLYTGVTTDVARRFAEHAKGKGASYLRGRAPLDLVFQKRLGSRSLALAVEYRVKHLTKAKKEELVQKGKHLGEIIKRVRRERRPDQAY